jgi:hypothetical protein
MMGEVLIEYVALFATANSERNLPLDVGGRRG